MGKKRRGRERLESCCSCGRTIPRDKAISYTRRNRFSTDLPTGDNVTTFSENDVFYCISCAKHQKIFEKKREQAARLRARQQGF